ncbi:MAG: hypothetical protein M1566_02315 [Thaumarchaeota archaeon]|nr:hypothetical protein [Nitrososphaerota archaeon]
MPKCWSGLGLWGPDQGFESLPVHPDSVQNAAFDAAKRQGLRPGEFFPAVYAVLLGSDRGPRLGPYVMDAGRAEVSRALLAAVGN